jgi:hypothetical protein
MSNRNTTEDLIKAWSTLNAKSASTKPKPADPQPQAQHPQAPSSFKPSEYQTYKLDIKEVNWDKFDVELDDDGEWPDTLKCDDDSQNKELIDQKDSDLNNCTKVINEYFDGLPTYNEETSIFEKCAWYQSYHYGLKDWGMHFLEDCWLNIAKEIKLIKATKTEAIKSAFLMVFCHELFHHLTDNSVTSMELIKGDPNLYINYSKNVYSVDLKKAPNGALEEALANRFVYGRYEYCKIHKQFLYRFLKRQPIGYNRFDDYNDQKFWAGRRELLNQVIECKSPTSSNLPLEQVYDHMDQSAYLSGTRMPIYIHYKKGSKQRVFIKNKA